MHDGYRQYRGRPMLQYENDPYGIASTFRVVHQNDGSGAVMFAAARQ